ncbi:hypothetical protein [Pseudothioclava nitratireducens]|jgi:hypothetical protein|uniref:hypothetical protein n=1 Tax=Pseudothioclava nitratireducens TaxID=1928646 RepID=UPI0023DA4A81|nr:hypothetical protein [Defluviimonas nitratireducens]MDF1620931.1 hypothetical protein [Defluviimonas nitratireducens]
MRRVFGRASVGLSFGGIAGRGKGRLGGPQVSVRQRGPATENAALRAARFGMFGNHPRHIREGTWAGGDEP